MAPAIANATDGEYTPATDTTSHATREAVMYFDPRLFAMTRGVRGRIVLAALIGVVAVPVAIWRLTLTGTAMANVFEGDGVSSITGLLVLIGALIVLRCAMQYVKDEIAHSTAAIMKTRLRRWMYEHVLRLGP